jgi:AcrR family transcriptional regulator
VSIAHFGGEIKYVIGDHMGNSVNSDERKGHVERGRYHHGDLRSALIAVALKRVRSEGAEAFSLRDTARDVGVSSSAAYRHFPNRTSLLSEVAGLGDDALARRMEREGAGLSGRALLISVGRGYVAFAEEEKWLFQLIFGPRSGLIPEHRQGFVGPDGETGANDLPPTAFEQLRGALSEVRGVPEGVLPPALLALGWATVHGLSSLVASGVLHSSDARVASALEAYADAAEQL